MRTAPLGQRDRRHLDRKAARLPDAALYLLGAHAEVGVARIDVAPGIDDSDDGLPEKLLPGVSHLQRA